MPRRDRAQEPLAPSVEVMLAEHERLSDLYLYNVEMGEKRTSYYLSIVSTAVVILLGASQLIADPASVTGLGIVILVGISILGLLTFQRLIERRIRATEYLRAINRIHGYFVQRDHLLEPYFYWPPCDDVPSFGGKGVALKGLRDVIAALNSLFIAVLVGVIAMTLWPTPHYAVPVASGIVAAIGSWLLHYRYASKSFVDAERDALRKVKFPQDRERKLH
jgi:hypothetical protein